MCVSLIYKDALSYFRYSYNKLSFCWFSLLSLPLRNPGSLQQTRVVRNLLLEEQVVEELMATLSRMEKGTLSLYLRWLSWERVLCR